MRKKAARSAPKRRAKYFSVEESAISSYGVERKRKGYYLYGSELGQISDACETIEGALNCEALQYGGNSHIVTIDTNVPLDELFTILNSYAFEPALDHAPTFKINGAEISGQCLRSVVAWYHKQIRRDRP